MACMSLILLASTISVTVALIVAPASASASKLLFAELDEADAGRVELAEHTAVPWCRPRPCWSPYHHDGEQNGRPSCADALFDMLVDVSEKLTAEGYDWQICQGTLLGAIRDNDIIPWTADVDLCLSDSSWQRLRQSATSAARDQSTIPPRSPRDWHPHYNVGFHDSVPTVLRACENFQGNDWKFLDYKNPSVVYMDLTNSDTEPWPEPHKARMREILSGPKQFVEIRGRKFPAPREAKTMLSILYGGNWRTPNSTHTAHGTWRL